MIMRAIFYPYLSLSRLVLGFSPNRKSQPASRSRLAHASDIFAPY